MVSREESPKENSYIHTVCIGLPKVVATLIYQMFFECILKNLLPMTGLAQNMVYVHRFQLLPSPLGGLHNVLAEKINSLGVLN